MSPALFLMESGVCVVFTSSVSLLLSFPVLQNVIRQQCALATANIVALLQFTSHCLPHEIEILSAFAETSLFSFLIFCHLILPFQDLPPKYLPVIFGVL